MKFSISSTALSSKLQNLAKVLSAKPSIPILNNILFEIVDGVLTLTASDSETTMKATMQLDESDSNGRFTMPSRTILDATRELPDQPLHFDINLETLAVQITYQNGVYNFTAQTAEEYPRNKELEADAASIQMESVVLLNGIVRSLFATAQDELRPIMNGIYFDLKDDGLAIVATDGHKLVRTKNLALRSDVKRSFVLGKKPASLLRNILLKDSSPVEVKFDDRNAEVHFPNGMLSCRLLEGNYPNYASVIPQDNPNQITVDRKGLVSVLRRVLPFASESSQLIRLHVEMGMVELSSEDIDFATSAKESMVCDYVGIPMNIGFKGSVISEVLNNLDCDDVVVQLADPSKAALVVPAVQPENEEVLMLMMPMMLNDN